MKEDTAEPKLTEKSLYDIALIELALEQGDQKAYTELLDRYRDSLYALVLKMVGDPDDADDLTIESFTKAFKQLPNYKSNYGFSTWLFKIATNACISFMSRKKNVQFFSIHEPVVFEDGVELIIDVPCESLTAEQEMEREQMIEMMRVIVLKLTPHYRKLIELKYFQDKSTEEIAAKMKLPQGTVKAQLFKARELLANILRKSKRKSDFGLPH
jgi:RNA polymerase sigma factor (sigma-70 family)